jgi:hypothetical protein
MRIEHTRRVLGGMKSLIEVKKPREAHAAKRAVAADCGRPASFVADLSFFTVGPGRAAVLFQLGPRPCCFGASVAAGRRPVSNPLSLLLRLPTLRFAAKSDLFQLANDFSSLS